MNKKLLAILALVFLIVSCKKSAEITEVITKPVGPEIINSVNKALAGKDSLSQFATAFKKLALTEDELKNGITVLAPSNNAYTLRTGSIRTAETAPVNNYLPDSSVVKDYIISGVLNTNSFTNGALLTALSGKKLLVSKIGNNWYVNDIYINTNSLSADEKSAVFGLAGLLNSNTLPKVLGVSETTSFPGWLLTVYGRNFTESKTGNIVKIDGIAATVHLAEADSLVVTVPKGVTAGKITVTTRGRTLNAPQDLTFKQAHVSTFFHWDGSGFIQTVVVDALDNIWWVGNTETEASLYSHINGMTLGHTPWFQNPKGNGTIPALSNTTVWAMAINSTLNMYISSSGNEGKGYGGIFALNTADPYDAYWWAGSKAFSIEANTKDYLASSNITAMTTDEERNLIISNEGFVQQISVAGQVSTLITNADFKAAGGETTTISQGILKKGNTLYVTDIYGGRVWIKDAAGLRILAGNGTRLAKDGTGTEAQFAAPQGIAIDKKGNLYICDNYYENSTFLVRMINPMGAVTTIAGNTGQEDVDGIGLNASFVGINGIAIDSHGAFYIASDLGKIRKLEIK